MDRASSQAAATEWARDGPRLARLRVGVSTAAGAALQASVVFTVNRRNGPMEFGVVRV